MVDRRMAFLAHLAELRQRIIVSAATLVVTVGISLYFSIPLLKLLMVPAGDMQMVYLTPLEPFMVKVKVAFFAGVAVALPVILYQILAFAAPGMKGNEKKVIFPSILAMIVLFAGGVVFGYNYILEVSTKWLLAQAGELMKASVSISSYVTYAGWFLLGFGISFETPLFILLMVRMGIISPKKLRASWRYAAIIILLISAAITPDWSPVTMAVMSLPMLFFYFMSCLLAGFVAPKKDEETA